MARALKVGSSSMSTQVAEAQDGMGGAEKQVDNKSKRKEEIEKRRSVCHGSSSLFILLHYYINHSST